MPNLQHLRVTEPFADCAVIALNSPPSNIIGFEMMSELNTVLDQIASFSCLVLISGLPHFSTGVDVSIHAPDLVPRMLHDFHSVLRKIYSFEGVIASVLNGYTLGGGLELTICGDFLFAERDAQLGFPEIKLACFPPLASVLLPLWLGRRGRSLILSGDTISGDYAAQLGLIDRVIHVNRFEFAESFVSDFHKSSSIHAIKTTKRFLREQSGFNFEESLKQAEAVYLTELMRSGDSAEAVQAFLEKRPPRFSS
jgi:cyclohexa-1,5-dienecarbonyl-CoA hydratase